MFEQVNAYGWIFITSLAAFGLGCLGWYLNRSMIELAARLDRSDDAPKFSYLQQWLLPKYRAGTGRFANEEFHEAVDQRSQNNFARASLVLLGAGAIVQIGLWVYLYNFVDGSCSAWRSIRP